MGLIDWVRAADLEKAKEITRLADAYIKDKLYGIDRKITALQIF